MVHELHTNAQYNIVGLTAYVESGAFKGSLRGTNLCRAQAGDTALSPVNSGQPESNRGTPGSQFRQHYRYQISPHPF